MSDPVESREIEDVLNNIRRLVSVDSAPAARQAGGDRLVLTSDLRVSPDDAEDAGGLDDAGDSMGGETSHRAGRREGDLLHLRAATLVEDPADTAPPPVADPASEQDEVEEADAPAGIDLVVDPGKAKTLEQRIAELEEAIARDGGEWEPDGSESQDQHRPDRMPRTGHDTRDEAGLGFDADEPAPSDETEDDATLTAIEDMVSAVSAEDDRSDFVAGTFDTGPDTGADSTTPEDDDQTASDEGEDAPFADDAEPQASAEAGDAWDDDEGYNASFASRRGAARPAWADPEPGQAEDTTTADDANTEFLEAEQAGRSHPRTTTRDPDPLRLSDDEAFIDEDALRELIAETVREELSGALGERITRNVKKLVRREIMRALAARDFE